MYLKKAELPKPNVSIEEREALAELNKDIDILVLPADKGKATVVIDRKAYQQKLHKLLDDRNVYEVLKKDPTTGTSIKRLYYAKLRELKREFI